MSEALGADPWANARSSLHRFEQSSLMVSRTWMIGAGALGDTIVMLIMLGLLMNLNFTRLRESFDWTRHSDAILLEIASIEQELHQGESGMGGFALTHDPAYLDALRAAKREWSDHREKLRNLLSDDPAQTLRFAALAPLIDGKFTGFSWFVGLDAETRQKISVSTAKAAVDLRALDTRWTAEIAARLKAFRMAELGLSQARRALAEHDSVLLDSLTLVIAILTPITAAAGFYLLFRDSHRRRARELQQELMHTQRLALMGETASMLAHEVSQPLAAATNYLSAMNRQLAGVQADGLERVGETGRKAGEQIARAAGIVRRLRDFIAKRDAERTIEGAGIVVSDAQALYETFSNRTRLTVAVDPYLPQMLIDRVQIQQVLVNLMRNALEAMAGTPRSELHLDVSSGLANSVKFALRDSGPGLPKEVSERLFRPFVSTKPDGMGVGLSICLKIVADHGGRIWAEAAPGGGTIFCFAIPGLSGGEAARAA